MTVNDGVAAVLDFVRVNRPIGAVAFLLGALGVTLAVFYLLAKIAARLPGRKTFDVGGTFDHFYSRISPSACSGVVKLIWAGYAGLWLSTWPAHPEFPWLFEPYDSVLLGVLATIIFCGLVAKGSWELAKATWFALRWLLLEARGVLWHITDSGEPHRALWLRRNGEYLYETTIRDHRMQQEIQASRERRRSLATKAAIAAVAIVVWQFGPGFIQTLYPLLPTYIVDFLDSWAVLPILTWAVFLFLVIPKTVEAIAALLDELIYQSGAQFITGAKVLEPRAARVGLKHVEEQNAHGDADFVKPTEAVRRMAGRPEL